MGPSESCGPGGTKPQGPSSIGLPATAEELSEMLNSSQVQTYSLDELKLLWQSALPFQRLLMLLALNGAFGRAEVASLRFSEVT